MKTFTQKTLKEFREKFYEGESNSVKCRKHNAFATPFEIESFILSKQEELVREIANELQECFGSGEEYPGESTDELLGKYIDSLLSESKEIHE